MSVAADTAATTLGPAVEKLGIVVLTHGEEATAAPLLASLLEAGVPAAKIVVVHNPTAPGQPPPEVPPGCLVRQTDRNVGFTGGMNLGIATRLGLGDEVLLLLTHDVRLRDGALGALLEAGRRHPEYGVLGPALVLIGTDRPFSFGGETYRDGTSGHILEEPAPGTEINPCDWVDGGTMLIAAEAIRRAGTFDERFWTYCEESDFCLRVRRAGMRVGVALDSLAEQDPGGARRPGPWTYLLTRNGAEYARRAVGIRGVVRTISRAFWIVGFNLVRATVREARRKPGGGREQVALAVGTGRGIIDFFRRRWGPPPTGLPGMGDVSNV